MKTSPSLFDGKKMQAAMGDFFTSYTQSDTVGAISNAHLVRNLDEGEAEGEEKGGREKEIEGSGIIIFSG